MKNILRFKFSFSVFLFTFILVSTLMILGENDANTGGEPYTVTDITTCGSAIPSGSPWTIRFKNPVTNVSGTIPCNQAVFNECCSSNPCHNFSSYDGDYGSWYIELELVGKCRNGANIGNVVWRNNNIYWGGGSSLGLAACQFNINFDFSEYEEDFELRLKIVEKCHTETACDRCKDWNSFGIRHIYISSKLFRVDQSRTFEFEDFTANLWQSGSASLSACLNCPN